MPPAPDASSLIASSTVLWNCAVLPCGCGAPAFAFEDDDPPPVLVLVVEEGLAGVVFEFELEAPDVEPELVVFAFPVVVPLPGAPDVLPEPGPGFVLCC